MIVIQGFRKGCKVGTGFSFKSGQVDFNASGLESLRICLSLFKIHKGVVLKLESLMRSGFEVGELDGKGRHE